MLKISRLAAFAILGIIAAGTASAEDKPTAKAGGITIPQERVDLRVKIVTAQGQPDSPELRKAVRDDLVNIELISQEALKKGLEKQPEIVQQLELARQSVLLNAFLEDYMKVHPLTDAMIEKEYDKVKSGVGDKEYNVRHILVETESEAKSIAAKLKKGGKEGNFDKLAKAKSKDASSKDRGGELGWVPVGNIPNSFVKPFGDALMNLDKGQVSAPVQSQFGWHIIKLDDVRDFKMPPLEELKPQLTQRLRQQTVKDLVTELRAKAKIE